MTYIVKSGEYAIEYSSEEDLQKYQELLEKFLDIQGKKLSSAEAVANVSDDIIKLSNEGNYEENYCDSVKKHISFLEAQSELVDELNKEEKTLSEKLNEMIDCIKLLVDENSQDINLSPEDLLQILQQRDKSNS